MIPYVHFSAALNSLLPKKTETLNSSGRSIFDQYRVNELTAATKYGLIIYEGARRPIVEIHILIGRNY